VRVPRDVAPRTVKVEVTVEDAPIKPPYNERVEVAKEPRADTEARVSLDPGQLAPVWRHTADPRTVALVNAAFVA
jgi:hypothetical protein